MCVNITWVFFRAREFSTAMDMLSSMFFMNPEGESVLPYLDIYIVMAVTLIMFLSHWFMRETSVKEVANKMPAWLLGIIWGILLILLAISQGSSDQFIYFQF
jgi:alginate O-acetyltransferase complex protein AlgI